MPVRLGVCLSVFAKLSLNIPFHRANGIASRSLVLRRLEVALVLTRSPAFVFVLSVSPVPPGFVSGTDASPPDGSGRSLTSRLGRQ